MGGGRQAAAGRSRGVEEGESCGPERGKHGAGYLAEFVWQRLLVSFLLFVALRPLFNQRGNHHWTVFADLKLTFHRRIFGQQIQSIMDSNFHHM